MSDGDLAKCGPFGSTSVSSFGSCSTYQSTYTPYPTYSSGGGSYTPYPTCPSDQWWDSGTSSCRSSSYTYTPSASSGSTYTPYPTYSSTPYPTYSSTPYPTTESTTTVYYPPTTVYTPPTTTYSPPATTISPSGFDSKAHQMAMARTIMACADSGGSWNAGASSCKPADNGFFANVLKIFSRFIR